MVRTSDHQPEEDYQRWLAALAKAMGSDGSQPEPKSGSKRAEPAGLWSLDAGAAESFPNGAPGPPSEARDEEIAPASTEWGKISPGSAPRIWDLCKPYVLLVGIVLVGGLAGIGGLVWLTQWWIPSSRPQAPSAPIEAQWEVRRRGLHILPDPETAPQRTESPESQTSAAPLGSEKLPSETP